LSENITIKTIPIKAAEMIAPLFIFFLLLKSDNVINKKVVIIKFLEANNTMKTHKKINKK
jgi:hypothetical protein